MTTEQFASWLKQWLVRHPVKSPADVTRATYTQDVMSRIQALSSPSPSSERWQFWRQPQWMLAVGGAIAAAVVVIVMSQPPHPQVAQEEAGIRELAQKSSDASQDIWRDLDILNQLDDAAEINAESLDNGSDENADELLIEFESLDHASSA